MKSKTEIALHGGVDNPYIHITKGHSTGHILLMGKNVSKTPIVGYTIQVASGAKTFMSNGNFSGRQNLLPGKTIELLKLDGPVQEQSIIVKVVSVKFSDGRAWQNGKDQTL